VVPSIWNTGPRDSGWTCDPRQPIEILRTIHSFDPWIACAVHVSNPQGDELIRVKIT